MVLSTAQRISRIRRRSGLEDTDDYTDAMLEDVVDDVVEWFEGFIKQGISTNLHEAVITTKGSIVAFFRVLGGLMSTGVDYKLGELSENNSENVKIIRDFVKTEGPYLKDLMEEVNHWLQVDNDCYDTFFTAIDDDLDITENTWNDEV